MKKESLSSFTQSVINQYQKLENYFTHGSFGVKFYPILMHPCVRHSQSFVVKTCAVLCVFIGLYFLFGELIAILFSDASLPAYRTHTTFELAQPTGTMIDGKTVLNSPLAFVVRASFLLQGYAFALLYFLAVMRVTEGVRLLTGLLAICFSVGMAMIYAAQGGQFTAGGLQNLGVSVTFLLGNVLMILTALTVKSPKLKFFKWFSLIGGLLGAAAIGFTLFEPTAFLPLLERVSLYAILTWEVAAGFAVLKEVRK